MADFIPRLTDDGIRGNRYWYADNVYYQSGYGMPNCTCYALGRWYELQGSSEAFNFPGYWDGADWYDMCVQAGYQTSKTIPQLGSIVSWSYSPSGHVAVVEEIYYNPNGSVNRITTSNSAYNGTFFWTETVYASDGFIPSWAPEGTVLNGFGYHPGIKPTPTPSRGKRKLKVWQMIRVWPRRWR